MARRRSIHYELKLLREQRELKRVFEALSLNLHRDVKIHHLRSNTLASGKLQSATLTTDSYGESKIKYWLNGGSPLTGSLTVDDAVAVLRDGVWDTLQAGVGANYRDQGSAELLLGEDPAGGKIRLIVFRIGAGTTFEELEAFVEDSYDSPISLKAFKDGMRVSAGYEDRKVIATLSFDSFSHDHQFVAAGSSFLWREYEDGLKVFHFAADDGELQLYLDELEGFPIGDGEEDEEDD